MPITSGFNHVATLTTDLDRFKAWYAEVFDADDRLRDGRARRPPAHGHRRPRRRRRPQRVRGRRRRT